MNNKNFFAWDENECKWNNLIQKGRWSDSTERLVNNYLFVGVRRTLVPLNTKQTE